MRAHQGETRESMTPEKSLTFLLEGNQRFRDNTPVNHDIIKQVPESSSGRFPFAVILSCIDPRIPTETIFDQGIGDLFNVRIAGNFVNEDILGSLEFACKVAGSKLILVMGHTSCGAVKGACDNAELGNLTQLLEKIKPAVDRVKTTPHEARNSSNSSFVDAVAKENVILSIEQVKEKSEVLTELAEKGEIKIVGAMYDVTTGKVAVID